MKRADRLTKGLVFCAFTLTSSGALSARAQTVAAPETSVDVAVTFTAQRSLKVESGQNFWAEGASVEFGANAFHGFGIGANVTGVHTAEIGFTGVPLSLVTETFGPRYRWHDGQRLSVYGEGLIGEANAFGSVFPSTFGAQPDAVSFASHVGGGVDVKLAHHVAVRVVEASWLRTQLPNSEANVQNNLQLGAGLVLRTGR